MKLILFDIDGTLVSQGGASAFEMIPHGESKFTYAIRTVFGLETDIDFSKYNGFVDRSILWECVKDKGITLEQFRTKMPDLARAMSRFMEKTVTDTSLYAPVAGAREFVDLMVRQKTIAYGVLTGNVESIAHWKLEKAGFDDVFRFGLYGEEADDRISLAKTVFVKAHAFFHTAFQPHDITVIGDTVHDIRCGKAIGAHTIAVKTGRHVEPAVLVVEQPDFLVDTLMDNAVLDYFGLKQV